MVQIRSIWLIGFLLLSGYARGAEVTIDAQPPVIEHRSFDPKHPPADMPKLHPHEAAVTQSYFGAESRVGGEVIDRQQTADGWRASIKVDTVRITLHLRVTVWLPDGAVPKIVNHEEGHRSISEHYYKDAEAIARKEAEALVGRTVTGRGSTPESAGDNALQQAAEELGGRYLAQTDKPCSQAQDRYDQITAHGTNPVKEEKAIEDAIRRTTASP